MSSVLLVVLMLKFCSPNYGLVYFIDFRNLFPRVKKREWQNISHTTLSGQFDTSTNSFSKAKVYLILVLIKGVSKKNTLFDSLTQKKTPCPKTGVFFWELRKTEKPSLRNSQKKTPLFGRVFFFGNYAKFFSKKGVFF